MAISGAKMAPKWGVHNLAEAGFQSGRSLMLTKPWDFNHALDKPCCRAGVLAMRDWGHVLLVASDDNKSDVVLDCLDAPSISARTASILFVLMIPRTSRINAAVVIEKFLGEFQIAFSS